MYIPNAQYIYIKKPKIKFVRNKWHFNNHNFYMIFSREHFFGVEEDIKQQEIGEVHYFDSILKTLNLTKEDLSCPSIFLPETLETTTMQKARKMNLSLDKFVILAPEALTCEELPVSFWQNLTDEFQKRNIDVFLNVMDEKYQLNGIKTIKLDFQEIYYLATKAKAIISLRSGLSEFLLPTNVLNIAIYTKFGGRIQNAVISEKTMKSFSMLKLPFVNKEKIIELNFENYNNEKELIEEILKNIKGVN